MARYRVHFVDHGDRVFDAMTLEHDTDKAAIEEAHHREFPASEPVSACGTKIGSSIGTAAEGKRAGGAAGG